jgi:predicted phosphoribosyltransferase
MKVFRDRVDAGQQLAKKLEQFADRPNTIVLALPRGGVPVGVEIARKLNLPLDVLVVRKLGAPDQPELAMGAIASGGAVVMNPEVYAYFAGQQELIDAITARERAELERREHAYRGSRPPLSLQNRMAILVDDGAATGASMRVAVQALRAMGATRIVAALPVCSIEAKRILKSVADEVICIEVPRAFYAVGQWYEDFGQTTDEDVQRLLATTN